MAYDFVDLQDF
ncbi:hypothetical protein VCHE16_0736, partial [Vibrio paracholerae HE-16]